MNYKQGVGKRQLQERDFEIVANHITINEAQLPQVSRQSIAALKHVLGHNMKKYSGTSHQKPGNDHNVVAEVPRPRALFVHSRGHAHIRAGHRLLTLICQLGPC